MKEYPGANNWNLKRGGQNFLSAFWLQSELFWREEKLMILGHSAVCICIALAAQEAFIYPIQSSVITFLDVKCPGGGRGKISPSPNL